MCLICIPFSHFLFKVPIMPGPLKLFRKKKLLAIFFPEMITIAVTAASADTIVVTPNVLSPTTPTASYRVTCSNGVTLSGVGPTFAFSGLSAQTYTFTAVAVNNMGQSSAESAQYTLGATIVGLPNNSDFSSMYVSELAEYTRKIWVAPNGLDTNEGTFASPYSLAKAVYEASNSGTAIMLLDGTYYLNNTVSLNGVQCVYEGALDDGGKAIGFFGRPGKTILLHTCTSGSGTTSNGRDVHAWACRNPGTVARGIVFKLNPNSSQAAVNHACSILGGLIGTVAKGLAKNCVFTSVNNISLCYGNAPSPTSTVSFVNCSFLAAPGYSGLTNYNAFSSLTITNCVRSTGIVFTGTQTGNTSVSSYIGQYVTVGAVGVYSGTNPWLVEGSTLDNATPKNVAATYTSSTSTLAVTGTTCVGAKSYTALSSNGQTATSTTLPVTIQNFTEIDSTIQLRANYDVGSSSYSASVSINTGYTYIRIKAADNATYPNTYWDTSSIRIYDDENVQKYPTTVSNIGNWNPQNGNAFNGNRVYCSANALVNSTTGQFASPVRLLRAELSLNYGARWPSVLEVLGSNDGVNFTLIGTSGVNTGATTVTIFPTGVQ